MNDLIDNLGITELDGEAAVSSLSVAKAFGRRHSDVLKRIRALDRHTDFCTRNFKPGTYRDRRGMPHPLVVMTYNGFSLWFASLKKDKDVARIAEAYLAAFDAMEQRRRAAAENEPSAGEMDASGDIQTLQTFSFQGHPVRPVLLNGELWWVAKDVCDALELNNLTEALRGLDEDEKLQLDTNIINPEVGGRGTYIISEAGLYSLTFRSRKPEAKKFKHWVTHEVLPSIRRRGYYISPKAQNMPPAALRELAAAATQITTAVTELARLTAELAGVTAAVARRQDDVDRRCAALERRLAPRPARPTPENQLNLFMRPHDLLDEARRDLHQPREEREPVRTSSYTTIGPRLRELRKEHYNMSPDEFAELTGVTATTLMAIEAGISRPGLGTLSRLRLRTGVSADWLLFGEGPVHPVSKDYTIAPFTGA